jgi:hypothetical protein
MRFKTNGDELVGLSPDTLTSGGEVALRIKSNSSLSLNGRLRFLASPSSDGDCLTIAKALNIFTSQFAPWSVGISKAQTHNRLLLLSEDVSHLPSNHRFSLRINLFAALQTFPGFKPTTRAMFLNVHEFAHKITISRSLSEGKLEIHCLTFSMSSAARRCSSGVETVEELWSATF